MYRNSLGCFDGFFVYRYSTPLQSNFPHSLSKPLLQIPGYKFSAERAFTYIALFIDTYLLYLVSRKIANTSPRYSFLVVLVFYSSFYVFAVLSFYDPVLFELMFGLIALLLINSKLKLSYAYGALAMVVAFFFKQTAIIIFVSILTYYLLNKRVKEAIGFLSIFILIVVPAIIYINGITNGGFIESVFILPITVPKVPISILVYLALLAINTMFIPFLLLSLIPRAFRKLSLLNVVFIFEMLSIISLEKSGSTIIYLLEPLTFTCIIGISNLERINLSKPAIAYGLFAILAIFSSFMFGYQSWTLISYKNPANPYIVYDSFIADINPGKS